MVNKQPKGRSNALPVLTPLMPAQALAILKQHIADEKNETPPAGFYDYKYWGKAWGTPNMTTRRYLHKAVAVGLADVHQCKRGAHHVNYYRFKERV